MAKLISVDNHKNISLADNIAQISEPILSHTDVTAFGHIRLFKDGSRLELATHGDWLEHHFQQEYHSHSPMLECTAFKQFNILIWDQCESNILMQDARENFDLCHGISIIKSRKTYMDIFNFVSSHEHWYINNWYLNNISVLQRFISHYKDASAALINTTKPYVLDKPLAADFQLRELHQNVFDRPVESGNTNELMRKTILKRWQCQNNKNFYLTQAEIKCIYHLMQGLTAKSIARELNISHRTVETHVKRIRNKLGVTNKTDLIKYMKRTSFLADIGHSSP